MFTQQSFIQFMFNTLTAIICDPITEASSDNMLSKAAAAAPNLGAAAKATHVLHHAEGEGLLGNL